MPKLSRLFLRSGFICLAVGMLVGGLILVQKGIGRFPFFWILLPAHVYLVLVGGVMQCALGVSYWILPRLPGRGRGNTALAWAGYWSLSTAILLIALHPAAEALMGAVAGDATFVCGGLLQGVAAVAFAWHAWPRIRASSAPGPAAELQVSGHPAPLALAGLLSLAVAIGIGRFVYTPILPYMTAGLGLAKSEAGLIASANFLGYLLGALAAAWRAAPGDPRHWLLGALVVSGLSTGAMTLTTGLASFLLLRFVGGAAGSLVMVLASSLVMDRLAAAGRAAWAAAMYAGVGTGIAISAVAVPATASGSDDWQGPWLFCGALSLALSILIAAFLRTQPVIGSAGTDTATRDGAQDLRRFILAYGLFGFGYVITATFVSDMVRADPLLQPAEHWVWLCVGLTAAPSAPLWTWAGRRWGTERAFAAACLIEAVGVALSVSGGMWRVLLGAGLLGGTFVGLTAMGLVKVRRLSGPDPRRNLALMTAAFGLGQMAGPTLAGVLHDSLGSYLVPSLLAVSALIAAAGLAARR